ncbi:phage/plasmid primase, P4 family [Paludisphaera soli]|uniref:phage/plasmid primase, P4 family n=1 Tax=Paludisphaera soli TaxID=2712865 RepID=UPI0013ED6813|nr:phage/plasmid primase, P4 family [Paludisphaera soli]
MRVNDDMTGFDDDADCNDFDDAPDVACVVELDALDAVPAELRRLPRWVVWRTIVRNGKATKVPFQVGGSAASTTDPATWTTFDAAAKAFREAAPGRLDGLGFVFTGGDPYVGVDFDGCLMDGGEIAGWAQLWLDRLRGGYMEVSPSGKGVKVWVRGKLSGGGSKRQVGEGERTAIEVYDEKRYFTVTGVALGRPDGAIPERQEVVDDLYRWVKERPSERSETPPANRTGGLRVRDTSGPMTDEQRASAYLAKVDPAIEGQDGSGTTLRAAMIGPGFDLAPDVAFRLLRDEYNPRCEPPWSDKDLRRKVDQAYLKEGRRGWLLDAGGGRTGQGGDEAESLDAVLARKARTDMGNGERFAARHGGDVRYCKPWGDWLVWDGRRYAVDRTGAVQRLAKDTARRILVEAATLDGDDQKRLADHAIASQSKTRIDAMIAMAATEPGIPILPEEMNRDGWLLNCRNGTIDLRTGELRPHDRADLITQLCPVDFDPDAECPQWEATLDLFFDKNQALIAYWQRVCGYALVGVVRDHVMPVCYGDGSNGKSTILGTLLDVLGTCYAMKAPPAMLMAKAVESHPTDRADLHGKRLVVAIETEAGRRLDEVMVKELTGGDRIRARRMRQDFWEFSPTHTIIMATNHKPVVKGTDNGVWRRLRMIPFAVKVDAANADTAMPDKLRAEFPGILAWCVRGCLAWKEVGLAEPDIVSKATAEYRSEQDVVGLFLGDRALLDPSVKRRCSEVYQAYQSWAESAGERAMTLRAFGDAMKERGVETKTSNGKWYVGVGLKPLGSGQAERDDERSEQWNR